MGWRGQGLKKDKRPVRDCCNKLAGDMKGLGGCRGLRAHLFALALWRGPPDRCPTPKPLLPLGRTKMRPG